MKTLAVKNFDRFQHYKDRAPSWIKLYNALLDDYAFLSLPDAARSHLILIWLIASRHENRIPYDAAYLQRAIHAKTRVDLATLIRAGFLIVVEEPASDVLAAPEHKASEPIAESEQIASPHARGRALAREREEKRRDRTPKSPSAPDGASPEFDRAWTTYPQRAGSNSRREAMLAWAARIRDGEDPAAMIAGIERYRAFCEDQRQIGTPYVMQGKRFFGPSKLYAEPWDLPDDPADAALDARMRALRDQQDADQAEIERRLEAGAKAANGNGAHP